MKFPFVKGRLSSGAELREKVANRLATSAHTPALYHATERLRAHNPRALREGGDSHAAIMYMMQKDPHDFHNKLLLSSNKDYRALEKQQQKADKRGDTAKSKELAAQLRDMEVKAFEARREGERKMAGYVLQLGAGMGAFAAAAPAGPFAAYAAGTGAFAGVGIALDQEIHADIKAGDWSGALDHSSYHLPFIGSGRNSWDAWHAGKPWNAAGHAGLFGVEALGLRGVGKLQGAGRVRGTVLKGGGAKGARLKTEQGRVGEKGRVKEAKQREGVAQGGNYLNDAANISSLSDEIVNINKATSGGGVVQNTSASQIVASASYYSTPLEQGSAIFRGIIQNHLFIDGNHRTAVTAFRSFASKNGIKVGLSDSELMNIAKQVSVGQLEDVCSIGAALSK